MIRRMVTLKDVIDKCPSLAWAQHRFSTEVKMPSGRVLTAFFDIPNPNNLFDRRDWTPANVAEQFSSYLGESAKDPSVCESLAHLLNERKAIVYRDVAMHLKLSAQVLNALGAGMYLLAWLMLRALADQLLIYQGQLWVYEWPEWVTLVETLINEQADPLTRQVIANMGKSR